MSTELTVREQKQVAFYDDQVTAVRMSDETIFVPLKPICDLLGVAWAAQLRRINRDLVLSQITRSVTVTVTDIDEQSSRPRTSHMIALPLDYLNGWLFGISASRVKEEVRDRLVRYQIECYQVLADAFGRNLVTARPDDQIMTSDTPAALAYRNALEVANLARQQYYLEQRLESAETTLASTVARVDAIEAELGNDERFITVSQAEQLSQAVRSVGLIFSQMSGRNEYGGVYGELHRRFGINSYKRLPAAKFEDAMNWLRQWYEELTDGDSAAF